MKLILQNLGNGETSLVEVPCPIRKRGMVLCQTSRSLVSLGTEKMLIDFGKSGWLAKARSQPDKVKQVIQKISTDGLWPTVEAVRAKLDTPIALGYCHVGRVVESDSDSAFLPGDRIVSNGNHAEIVVVPEKLMAKIPDNVSDDAAAFTVVAAIGLQGIRLAAPTLGERFVVSGLGLIGLLTVQMLKAHGCQVLGIDYAPDKLSLAKKFGADIVDLAAGQDPVRMADHWSGGNGVDGVIVTASTKGDELMHQAATMCRKRARIILVGVVGLNLQRADFYEKELTFQVSCSYGPGRYDPHYEQLGLDYPIGFVRWTEQRNFQAVLQLMSEGKLQTDDLITHRFHFDQALTGYQAIGEKGAMGILLEYDSSEKNLILARRSAIANTLAQGDAGSSNAAQQPVVAFIGAGGFTTRMLLPLLPKNARRRSIISSTGVSAAHAARKFSFENSSSDLQSVLSDDAVNTVFITTPHNTHARFVCRALSAGKHVFVEKPLALNADEVDQVRQALEENRNRYLMIGFNRRFSPHSRAIKKWLKSASGPLSIIITVNAGKIPSSHWTQDRTVGGGRIVGEGCHFIDLARYFSESPICELNVNPMAGGDGRQGDCVAIQLGFESGSIATIHYLANGHSSIAKERIEIFSSGQVYSCHNFRHSWGTSKGQRLKTRSQDKGHATELQAFLTSISQGSSWPISAEEQLEVSLASIEAADQVYRKIAIHRD